jgi:hypothetical protein
MYVGVHYYRRGDRPMQYGDRVQWSDRLPPESTSNRQERRDRPNETREPETLPLWETVSVVQGTTGISTPAVGDRMVLQEPRESE